jgi:hypothetical protein
VSDQTLFKEDFFERVVDVNWESEPKVYWVCGTGAPLIVNGMIMGDNHGWAFTSGDGKHWSGTDLFKHDGQGIGALYTGCWLREGLEEGNAPVWMMAGGTSKTVCASCASYTTTGTDYSADDRTVFDDRHACDFTIFGGGSSITVISQFDFPDWHTDRFNSSNGRTWSPKKYHGDDADGFAAAATGVAPIFGYSPVAHFVSADPADPKSLLVPINRPLLTPMPTAGGSGGSKKADKMIFNPSTHYAAGKVKKGPFKGKTISVEIKPYHNPPGGGAHGDSTVEVTVIGGDEQEEPQTASTGITRTIAIGYGYYTFVIGGSSGGGSSTVAWEEDRAGQARSGQSDLRRPAAEGDLTLSIP